MTIFDLILALAFVIPFMLFGFYFAYQAITSS